MRRHTVSPRAGRAQTRGDSARTSGGTPSHGRDGNGAEILHLRAVSFKGFYLSASPFYLKRLRAAASTIDAAPRIAAATSGSGTCVIPT